MLRVPCQGLTVGALVLLLSGCASQRDTTPDPLLGSSGARAAAPTVTPPGSATGPAQPSAAGVLPLPPMPAPSSLTSNAALTAGGPRPLEGGFDLRLGTGSGPQAAGAWVGPGGPSGAVLTRPEVPAQPVSRPDAAPAGPARATTYEQAQALLTAYGVTWQRLEYADGSWKFTCSVPNRQNANLSRTYEAQAKDDVSALRAVIEQIEKEPH